MKISAVKLFENGYMLQPFAFGGEEGPEKFDPRVRYRSSLQNYVIDTGKEVILVDTGMPKEFPEQVPDEKTPIFMGNKITDYVSALKKVGYEPEQVSKILVTHKHADHSGELRSFPNAQIFASRTESESDELKLLPNVTPVDFTDGPYYNFPKSQTIAPGIHYIEAKGHTTGNSIVIVEDGDLFYMIHGDITYCDEALYANKLSVVFEDVKAARESLDRVREFISNHPTVYCSTHTPLGYENLESRKVIDLNNPPEIIPPKDIKAKTATGKYVCSVCGYVYDPEKGDPEHGIPAGTAFADLPDDWTCPRCHQPKSKFTPA
ncbi:MAG: rubredoxin [Eubacterium sp.]